MQDDFDDDNNDGFQGFNGFVKASESELSQRKITSAMRYYNALTLKLLYLHV